MTGRLLSAFAAALFLCALELFVVVGFHQRDLAGTWEVQYGSLWLAPMLLLIAAAAALPGALLLALLERAERRPERAVVALGLAAFSGAVGWAVGGGRQLATLGRRAGFAGAVALGVAVAAHFLAPRVARWLRDHPWPAAAGALGAIVALELVNRFLLVRLYPPFHGALAILALVTAPLVTRPLEVATKRSRAYGLALAGLATLGAALGARPAAERLSRFDNYRLVLLDAAPIAGQGVRWAARLVPPPPLADDDDLASGPSDAPTARSLDFRGRDILLVSIDALRADHVSSYGYARPTTPNIDALAANGVRMTHAYAPTPHTSYSVTSLMTGKYMRPLLLQGAGADSDTWAGLLRTYSYRTAAFYPPAVFFIDPDRFTGFRDNHLGFEYAKVEFIEGQGRVDQVKRYLAGEAPGRREFIWVHLFSPHEPYEAHPEHDFGDRDVDRYDAEIADADATVGKLAALFRQRSPSGVVIVTADHGEEFGEHGGHYHGSSVYEEQVRVPMLINAPGLAARTVPEVVQTIDLLPTLLSALDIPRPPRMRGRDLGPVITGARPSGPGLALAETEEQSLLAEGSLRLICQRKIGACQLFDLAKDPGETTDRTAEDTGPARELRARLRELGASHGRYEVQGLRKEGKGWPAPILRGISGDGDAAEDVAALLDDADVAIRRKAAEVLFELGRPESAAALRLALTRDEDDEVRRYSALGLTRLDQGAPLVNELLHSDDVHWQRLAALALAESGDKRGDAILVAWWKDAPARDYQRSRQLLAALAKIKSKDAVWPLVKSLDDVRLRPYIAQCLAAIGEDAAKVPLVKAFAGERYQSARVALAQALVSLGAGAEMAEPLVHWLGVPDPIPNGLDTAERAKILPNVGGPEERDRRRLTQQSGIGVKLQLVVPRGGNGRGVRLFVRARAEGKPGEIRVGPPFEPLKYDRKGMPVKDRNVPRIHPDKQVRLSLPAGDMQELHVDLPASFEARAGRPIELVVFAEGPVGVDAIALVPLADELPPPPPEPWRGTSKDGPDTGSPQAP